MSEDGNNLGMADMSSALSEVSKTIPEQNFVGAPEDNKEAETKAREHQWPEKVPYNYSLFLADKDSPTPRPTLSLAQADRYEFLEEYGDVDIGPPIPELEKQLFNEKEMSTVGSEWKVVEQIKVEIVGPENRSGIKDPIKEFTDTDLHPAIHDTLKLMKYEKPTPIQCYTIPAVLQGKDVVVSSQTGSGKTASYLIPIVSRLIGKANKLRAKRPNASTYNARTDRVRAEPLVLIVAPTRELATQIFTEARRLCYRTKLRPCLIYGGDSKYVQISELNKGCDVLVATPGRLLDIMGRPDVLTLGRVKYTVIDEADELLHGDWEEDMNMIMSGGDVNEDADHVYMMFSATFPKEFRRIARQYMEEDYVRLRAGRYSSTHQNIKQMIMWVEESNKRACLYDLLFGMPPARVVIFVNVKQKADEIDDFLYNKGLASTTLHGDRTQREREDAMYNFNTGKTPILITTGIAARGMDFKNVMHVINYDLPNPAHGGIEEYIHRIGRTGRIGHTGLATSFYSARDEGLAVDLVKLLMENKQEVPSFLEEYQPVDGVIDWSSDEEGSDDESIPDVDAGNTADNADTGSPWVTDANGSGAAEDGFQADDSFKPDGNTGVPAGDGW